MAFAEDAQVSAFDERLRAETPMKRDDEHLHSGDPSKTVAREHLETSKNLVI
jgi:hypothetical protein